jgi:hypothetical protein
MGTRVLSPVVLLAAVVLAACSTDGLVAPIDAPLASSSSLLAPTNVTAIATSETTVDIAWEYESQNGSTRFEVARAPNLSGTYLLVATVAAGVLQYTDGTVVKSTGYCYQVRAIRTKGKTSTVSPYPEAACVATPPQFPPPAAPTEFVVAVQSATVLALSWQDNSSDESHFEIFRSSNGATGDFYIHRRLSPDVISVLDDWLTEGREYCYRVRATRILNDVLTTSEFTPVACGVPASPPPPPPSPAYNVTVTPYDTWAYITWSATTWTFSLERSTDGGPWELLGTGSGSSWWDGYGPEYGLLGQPLTPEQRVCYRVIIAETEPSSPGCTTPPAAPSEVIFRQIDDSTMELTWKDNSAVEDGYEIRNRYDQCQNDGFGTWWCFEDNQVVAVLPPGATSLRISYADYYHKMASEFIVVTMKDGGYGGSATSTWMGP